MPRMRMTPHCHLMHLGLFDGRAAVDFGNVGEALHERIGQLPVAQSPFPVPAELTGEVHAGFAA